MSESELYLAPWDLALWDYPLAGPGAAQSDAPRRIVSGANSKIHNTRMSGESMTKKPTTQWTF